ncbi:Cyclin-T2, partial [Schistosoma japonicum]
CPGQNLVSLMLKVVLAKNTRWFLAFFLVTLCLAIFNFLTSIYSMAFYCGVTLLIVRLCGNVLLTLLLPSLLWDLVRQFNLYLLIEAWQLELMYACTKFYVCTKYQYILTMLFDFGDVVMLYSILFTNRIENSVSHSGGGEHKAHYPPAANRVHGTEYRMASAGYNPVSNKQSCGRDEHEDSRINSGNPRSIKPAGHPSQGNARVKPDLNDYF